MHEQAYAAQCKSVRRHAAPESSRGRQRLTLLALAFGSFCIGTSEFASMGVLQLFAKDLGLSIPTATNAISAYALGVVIGAPAVTLAASRLHRRTLLLALVTLFAVGNLLSSFAVDLPTMMLARFVAGLPQGGYFGAGAVVAAYVVGPGESGRAFAIVMTGLTIATIVGSPLATLLGQTLGWRDTYRTIAVLALFALAALWLWTPRADALEGGPVAEELRALRKPAVWGMALVAAIGVGSIFAVYTFIGPFITDVDHEDRSLIPVALSIFGVGMTVGNMAGGRLADRNRIDGIVLGFGCALAVLAALALGGRHLAVLLPCLFGVGATMMAAIPTIQVRLTDIAPDSATLMGAMNLAALNVANTVGAYAGGISIAEGFGLLSPAWAGFICTFGGLLIFLMILRSPQRQRGLRDVPS